MSEGCLGLGSELGSKTSCFEGCLRLLAWFVKVFCGRQSGHVSTLPFLNFQSHFWKIPQLI